MCHQNAEPPTFTPVDQPHFDAQSQPSTGSRQRRIWDLPHQCHCPLVGICLPIDTLRKLVNKALGGQTRSDDYEVHVGAVAECGHRSRLAEVLQDALAQRYERLVQQFRQEKTTEAVALLWKKTVEQGEVAGALWAALTHPRCDTALQEVICRNMHMLQHHAGANMRAGITEFNALLAENAVLARELGKVQTRSSRIIADKSSEVERLNAQLMKARTTHISQANSIAFLNAALTELKASTPDFESSLRLQKKIAQMAVRQTELAELNGDLRQKLALTPKLIAAVTTDRLSQAEVAVTEQAVPPAPSATVDFYRKEVLCVGGRSGNVASYRDLIERVGGRFSHHDGGLEDSHHVLNANLAAADLVICQTGCISHNAYWKVKDFCKRTGKRCIFVENPSTSSLARGLEQVLCSHDTPQSTS